MKHNPLIVAFAICLNSFSVIYSMDKPIIKKKPACMIDNQSLAWTVILKNDVKLFNYKKINALAATSKKLEQIVLSTADDRKKYLTQQLNLSKNAFWHKYGAMGGQAAHNICPICLPLVDIKKTRSPGLDMNRFYLDKNPFYVPRKHVVQGTTVYYSNFSGCLSFAQQHVFNNKNDFYVYGYHKRPDRIVEYSLAYSPKTWQLLCADIKCATNIQHKESTLIGLQIFLEFRPLLKAFLQSCKTHIERRNKWDDNPTKVYAIEGVTIPKNYTSHQSYFPEAKYRSFDDLPAYVKDAIVKRYKQQELDKIEEFMVSKIEKLLIAREVQKRGKQEILQKIENNGKKKPKEGYGKQRDMHYTKIDPCLKISSKFFKKDMATDPLTQTIFQSLRENGRGLGNNTQYSWIKKHETKGIIKVKSLFYEKDHLLVIVENCEELGHRLS